MYDLITPISQALQGDTVFLKTLTKSDGYIVDARTKLYFQKFNSETETVVVSPDPLGVKAFNVSLRAIKQITNPLGAFIFKADPRDIVYGQ